MGETFIISFVCLGFDRFTRVDRYQTDLEILALLLPLDSGTHLYYSPKLCSKGHSFTFSSPHNIKGISNGVLL